MEQEKAVSPLSYAVLVSVVLSLVPAFLQAFPFWKDMGGSYFHQPFLLAVTAWLVLQSRKKLVSFECSGTGGAFFKKLLILLVSSYFYWITLMCGLSTLLSLAVPLYIGATIYVLFDEEMLQKNLVFLFLLCFSFPLPNLLITAGGWFLKMGTIRMSTIVLGLFDNSTVCAGSTLQSFGQSVKIASSCSGINSLLILIPLLVIASRLYPVPNKRIVWIWLSLPLTIIVCNTLRVVSMFLASPLIDFGLSLKHFHTVGPVFFFINAWIVLFMMRRLRR